MAELPVENTTLENSPTSQSEEYSYIDRDISWLSFNYRVLEEARDPSLPLYERIKFLAIYSSNLDEFFRVRVASIRSILKVKKKKRKKLGLTPEAILGKIHEEVARQQNEFGQIFRDQILPELEENNIRLLRKTPDDEVQLNFIRDFFSRQIKPYMHPELLKKGKIIHFLRDHSIYLALELKDKNKKDPNSTYAILLVPTHHNLPRFTTLPLCEDNVHTIIFLEDIIRTNLDQIFPGYYVEQCCSIKMSRDADLKIEDELEGSLVEKIKNNLLLRAVNDPARFLYDPHMSAPMLRYLRKTFGLSKEDLVAGGQYHNFNDFFGFPNPLKHVKPELEIDSLPQLPHSQIDKYENVMQAMAEEDRILHFPYQTYDYVLRFLNEAALDPDVKEIKTTQYRVASDSAIVGALINAARNGKDVTVFVEIKARFDEQSNLRSAENMMDAGVKVIYSNDPKIKVHAKVALVRREEEGKLKGYAFLSTGNFNEKTARIYADHGLLTADQRITDELNQIFTYFDGKKEGLKPAQKSEITFNHLLVAQFNAKDRFKEMIDREIQHVQAGKKGHIIIKLNNLEERSMIDKLYEASNAGVKIDMVVRGICCLRPGVKGMSENITITRIVDRYLEHARIFHFHNDGDSEVYIGSADWMDRNLNRRVEVVFPIYHKDAKEQIMHIVNLQFQDNVKAVRLDSDLNNIHVPADPANPVRAQLDSYAYVKALQEE
ncbi:MAG: polyphosphate kinase 1 [Bacteroidota bacterium]